MGTRRTTADHHRPSLAGSGPPAPTALRLQVMGPLRLWRGDLELDAGARQQRFLLAVLLARAGSPTSMAGLIDLIWGADPPGSAVNVIHKYVGALRRVLEPGLEARAQGSYLLRHGDGYRFVAAPGMLDLVEFRRLVAAARSDAGRSAAFDHYAEALRLCRGSAGGTLAGNGTAASVFAGVDQEFLDAVVAGAASAVDHGRAAEVLTPLRLAAGMSPLDELVHAALVRTLAAAGHQAEALAVYRAIRERLAEDLGIDPGPELRDAQQRVLRETVTRPAPHVHPAQLPPDQALFVGRAVALGVLSDLVGRMGDGGRTSPLVIAIDGRPGVGKSTLATHFAHRVAGRFADGQLYLDLHGRTGADEALRSLLHALGVRGGDLPDTLGARAGLYRSLTAGKRFLVLLDNVHDPDQVRSLLPNSAGSLVLITGRRPLIGLAVSDSAYLLPLDLPDQPEARELLTRRLSTAPSRWLPGPANADAVNEIVELCGRLPLALAVLAARLCARPQLSLGAVTTELRDGALWTAPFRGVGRAITERILADAFAGGADAAYLFSPETGRPLCASMGFRQVETGPCAPPAEVQDGAAARYVDAVGGPSTPEVQRRARACADPRPVAPVA